MLPLATPATFLPPYRKWFATESAMVTRKNRAQSQKPLVLTAVTKFNACSNFRPCRHRRSRNRANKNYRTTGQKTKHTHTEKHLLLQPDLNPGGERDSKHALHAFCRGTASCLDSTRHSCVRDAAAVAAQHYVNSISH